MSEKSSTFAAQNMRAVEITIKTNTDIWQN